MNRYYIWLVGFYLGFIVHGALNLITNFNISQIIEFTFFNFIILMSVLLLLHEGVKKK